MQFGSNIASSHYPNDPLSPYHCPLPFADFNQTIFAFWGDLNTAGTGRGIFTSTSGNAPSRIFNIEWRACQYDTKGQCDAYVNFEIRLYEGQSRFDLVYNDVGLTGAGPTNTQTDAIAVGAQASISGRFISYACDSTNSLTNGTLLSFVRQPLCPSPTQIPTNTPTNTPTYTPTNTPTFTPTACLPTPTPAGGCSIQFTDVPPGSTFYPYVRCLACQQIVDGYSCGGLGEPCVCANWPYFRPNNNVTRGQLSKIVFLALQLTANSNSQLFQDVAPGSPFYVYVNTLANMGVVNGYVCSVDPEPCVPPSNLPYFRPNYPANRGQMAKIILLACTCPQSTQTFQDVPPGSTYYTGVEGLAQQGAVNGYPCSVDPEPCVLPYNRPYYRPGNWATRGQAAKTIKISYFPNCGFVLGAPGKGKPERTPPGMPPSTPMTSPTVVGTFTPVLMPTTSSTSVPTTPTTPTVEPTGTIDVPPPWPTVPQPLPTGYPPLPVPTVPVATLQAR